MLQSTATLLGFVRHSTEGPQYLSSRSMLALLPFGLLKVNCVWHWPSNDRYHWPRYLILGGKRDMLLSKYLVVKRETLQNHLWINNVRSFRRSRKPSSQNGSLAVGGISRLIRVWGSKWEAQGKCLKIILPLWKRTSKTTGKISTVESSLCIACLFGLTFVLFCISQALDRIIFRGITRRAGNIWSLCCYKLLEDCGIWG